MLQRSRMGTGLAATVGVLAVLTATAFALDIDGTPGDDRIVGSVNADSIDALAGDDRVFARGGDDQVDGSDGDDRVSGGPGNDTLLGRKGDDALLGRVGDDTINGLYDDDLIRGAAGNDVLIGDFPEVGDLESRDRVYGASGDDQIRGGDARDRLFGGVGNDAIEGQDGNDLILGNAGIDTISGGDDDDRIFVTTKADVQLQSLDTARGDAGDDFIRAVDGVPDVVNCGDGRDRVVLDLGDVIEDAIDTNPNGSCERVTRRGLPGPGA